MIKDNLEAISKEIADYESESPYGQKVTLIAVSKTKPVSDILLAYDAGIRDFGENKVQEILQKYDQLPSDIRWHLIGHLQTNKVKYIVDKVHLIHSVDSLKLAETINKEAAKKDICADILVQVNISGEESKFGADTSGALDMIKEIARLDHVRIKGLMTIAPACENPEEIRYVFKGLRNLSIDIKALNNDNISMDILSMGMSSDFGVAIEEGATMVRVGTAIFGARNYSENNI